MKLSTTTVFLLLAVADAVDTTGQMLRSKASLSDDLEKSAAYSCPYSNCHWHTCQGGRICSDENAPCGDSANWCDTPYCGGVWCGSIGDPCRLCPKECVYVRRVWSIDRFKGCVLPHQGYVVKNVDISNVKLTTSCTDPWWGNCDFLVNIKSVTWADGSQTPASGGFPMKKDVSSPYWKGEHWAMKHNGPESDDLPNSNLLKSYPIIEMEIVEWSTWHNKPTGSKRITVQLEKKQNHMVVDIDWSKASKIAFDYSYTTYEAVDTTPRSTFEEI
uniref:Uncharacterized protein n=1 Tax=Eucampia antarctica TaxID=49252 RepID=A0A7S2RZW9_9STRA|mmetsp:Transcript_29057/g.27949  ORF Transcript_29057/g.27949 Transcript_29057/m.27949 type:complete len:273 (+) Transcript_29057:214-1032(+)|eukprot:CAMPEP_0197832054 /NCGR_PEP_ID=MMETSP1437-20131217/13108_1 /TAXON_ID=49252 ORGANISM="Eucampia antarctica, Strain CCMP1452" /NCGR_SAMPLE_ID=MMETSP1437 /ASSEMBLY_ACC=CAM_ASM_001096 /LENGTH=272 /DNA_ID=CAMNT_0043435231 /DNA_START=127 /DNA_END=945 /DNA_ORIENTATION=-